ncbi:TetR family transcriptional regulator [Aneurinibacillus soli]|uniref:Transcriptional regulator BetI n=1 Tax=Aneurinibacillus soli TaxID=1500254 RepID=A0A0U5BIH1_9BACL|nr:TetR/AcrR family transcriptional regulator [Aneurinibacillus soli]PYE64017.1 TetR family transcriptional regulator [Aneurinibacillus soli]BAU27966.1 transcriptional regulator BetI [Aneurinibacillus soli]
MIEIPATPTFQRLLATTTILIQELGCKKTTLQEIMKRSGLSKGAIYHYVKSKDELFGLLLVTKMQGIGQAFDEAVSRAKLGELDGPLGAITAGLLPQLVDRDHVVNNIFLYLLSQQDNPDVALLLRQIYDRSLAVGTEWIRIGQKYEAIPAEIDAEAISRQLLAWTYGQLVQHMIAPDTPVPNQEDVQRLFAQILRAAM